MLGLSPREARERFDAGHRLRRAARVRRPQAQELLVGHARPARVLGDDPGRRRHPADRRGARRRRRRVPAEVLRRVRADLRDAGKTVAARHARHGRGRALLRPRDAARARPASVEIGEPERRRPALPRASTSPKRARERRDGASADAEAHGPAEPRAGDGTAEILEAWFEDDDGDRAEVAAATADGARVAARALPRGGRGPALRHPRRGRPGAAGAGHEQRSSEPPTGRFEAGRRGRSSFSFPARHRPGPSLAHAHGRARGHRRVRDRPARALSSSSRRHASTPTIGIASTPFDASDVERAAGARAVSARRRRPRVGTPIKGPTRARQRPAPLLAPDAGRSRSPTSSCASSARCSATCGSSCARCCSSACSTSSSRSSSTSARRAVLRRRRCCSASSCSPSSPRRPAARCAALVDRENLVRKIEFPRLAVPMSRVLTALFNLGAEPDPRLRLPARRRRDAALVLARAAVRHRVPRRSSRSASRCCCRRSSCATATSSRSGTSCCR